MNSRLPLDRIKPKADFPADKSAPAAQERFSDAEMAEIKMAVGKRITEAFGGANDTEIARRCLTTSTTIKFYTDGQRLPLAEMLMQIHRASGVSLDWLLLGKGQRFIVEKKPEEYDEAEMIEIAEIARSTNRTVSAMIAALARAQLAALKVLEKEDN